MNRRNFIAKTGIVGASALLPISCSPKTSSPTYKYKMGYQLYSIRDAMADDPIGTLKALKKMGYEDFEAYGFDAENHLFYGYKSAEFKKILDDLDLTVTSGHYGFAPFLHKSNDELAKYVDQCIAGAKAIHSKYITWPVIPNEDRTMDNYKIMAEKLSLIGEQVTAADLEFAYHNHGFEFEDHNGECAYDIIMADTDPSLVKLEMDMYWVMHAGKTTPKELVKKQPNRFVMWHIKDMDKITRDYTEVGNGSIDYLNILPDADESGLVYYYLEQGGNFAHNSTRSASDSAEYCKKHLRKLI